MTLRIQGPMQEHSLASDIVGGWWISTIDRSHMEPIDNMIGLLSVLIGEEKLREQYGMPQRADLTAPGDYETMVFEWDHDKEEPVSLEERDFRRYTTREEAIAGHEEMIAKWESIK